MDQSAIKSAMLSAISEELDLWLDKANSITDGYEYESEFIAMTRQLNQILLSKSLGTVSSNRNKKKLHTCFGTFEVNKSHPLWQYTAIFGISSKLQELLCLLAQDHVFEESEHLLGELLGIDISAKQIQRVSEYYGKSLEGLELTYQEGEKASVPTVSQAKEESVYVMVDGSMIYTREEEWKEMKVGRIYSESSRVSVQEKRTEVMNSLYVCTLGNNKEFFKKFEP
jgi:hypothetical protein